MAVTSPWYTFLSLIFYLFICLLVWQVGIRFCQWWARIRNPELDYIAGTLPKFNWLRFIVQLGIAYLLWIVLYLPPPGAE